MEKMNYTLAEIKNLVESKIMKTERIYRQKQLLSDQCFLEEDSIDLLLDVEYFKGKNIAYRQVLELLKSVITD